MNTKFIVDTNKAPRAIGPYSQAVGYNGLLFCSGQIAIIPDTGELVTGGVEVQCRQVMENLQAVLQAAGLDFSHVLKTTIFLRNMNDFQLVNEIYGLYFDHSPPARATVEVSRLPKDVLVEIDMIAAAPADYSPEEPGGSGDDVDESKADDAAPDPSASDPSRTDQSATDESAPEESVDDEWASAGEEIDEA